MAVRSLRHLEKALAFADELRLDPNVFLAFYADAKARLFLEALNFWVQAEEYQSLPLEKRLIREMELIETYIQDACDQPINVEADVTAHVLKNSGKGRARCFYEAQLACAAILAAEPWEQFKASDKYVDALKAKPMKLKKLQTAIALIVDEPVRPAVQFLFTKRLSEEKSPDSSSIDLLSSLQAWLIELTVENCSVILDAFKVDFDAEAFRALVNVLGVRPRSLINMIDAIFAEGNVEHILEYVNDEPLYQLIIQKKLTAAFVAEFCTVTTVDFVSRHIAKPLKSAYKTLNFVEDDLPSVVEKHSDALCEAAVAIVKVVYTELFTISQEFKLLLVTAWKAGKKHSERTRSRRIVGRIVVEWLVDVLADPRKFMKDYEVYRSESKKSIMVVSTLIRSLIDFAVIDNKPYMAPLVEKFHQSVAELFEESLLRLVEPLAKADSLELAPRVESLADTVRVASFFLCVGHDYARFLDATGRGVPGVLLKCARASLLMPLVRADGDMRFLKANGATAPAEGGGLSDVVVVKKGGVTKRKPKTPKIALLSETAPDISLAASPMSPKSFSKSLDSSSLELFFRGRQPTDPNLLMSPASHSFGSDALKGSHQREMRPRIRREKSVFVERSECDGIDSLVHKGSASMLGSVTTKIDGVTTVVIFGGSIGSVVCAKALSKLRHTRVVYVDFKDYLELSQGVQQHIFEKDKVKLQQNMKDYRLPYAHLFQGTSVVFVNSYALAITVDKIVLQELTLYYDYLVIAPAYRYLFPPSFPEDKCAYLSVSNCRADLEDAKSVIILGGGLFAVELAADLVTQFRPPKRVVIVTEDEVLLPHLSTEANTRIRDWFAENAIVVECGESVAFVGGESPASSSGLTFSSSAGVPLASSSRRTMSDDMSSERKRAADFQLLYSKRPLNAEKVFSTVPTPDLEALNKDLATAIAKDGHLTVSPSLQVIVKGSPSSNIFALGDVVSISSVAEEKIDPLSQVRQAAHVAEQIELSVAKKPLKVYKAQVKEKKQVVRLGLTQGLLVKEEGMEIGDSALKERAQLFAVLRKRLYEDSSKSDKKVRPVVDVQSLKTKITVMAVTSIGRQTARWLVANGYPIRVLVDVQEDRSLFADSDHADVLHFSWSDQATLNKALEGTEVFLCSCDNGTKFFEHCMKVNAAIQACCASLKYVIKIATGVDQAANPRFAKHPLVEENKMVESSLTVLCEMLKIKHILIRTSFTFDNFIQWFADDIRGGALKLPAKSTSSLIALSDLSECAARIALDARKYSYQVIVLYENAYLLEDFPWAVSLALGTNFSFAAVSKDEFREILHKSGFTDHFAGTLVRIFADFSVSCSEIPSSDVAAKILNRTPLNLVQWAERNEHLFRQ